MIETLHGGSRVVAVRNRLYYLTPGETFHEFLLQVLVGWIGADWVNGFLSAEPTADEHPLVGWIREYQRLRHGVRELEDAREESTGVRSAPAPGGLKALIALAYDAYTLVDCGALQFDDGPLVKRVRQIQEFQGVRYEISVAAVFARAGYEVAWLEDTSRKLPEFIARDQTGFAVVVEAKSRTRPGVLGKAGTSGDEELVKADAGRLMRRALEKETDGLPFVVCLDLNMPNVPGKEFEAWAAELRRYVFDQLDDPTEDGPDPFSLVLITNYSWHWSGDAPAKHPESFVVQSDYPNAFVPDEHRDRIVEAVFQYGDVPDGWPS